MAAPITTIKKQIIPPEELQQQKLDDLKTLLTDNEDALNKIFGIVGELHSIGVLDAADSMLHAKEEIAKIALHQASREPVTNLINHFMEAAGALTVMDPEVTSKLVASVGKGMEEANGYLEENTKKIGMFDLLKVLNDPDINRAVGFGIQFLKGMGKGLKEEEEQS